METGGGVAAGVESSSADVQSCTESGVLRTCPSVTARPADVHLPSMHADTADSTGPHLSADSSEQSQTRPPS